MKTVIELAREAGAGEPESLYARTDYVVMTRSELERFAELVRANEREKFFTPEEARIALEDTDFTWHNSVTQAMTDKLMTIRNRGNT
jgi:hypothetical protein